MEQNSYIHDILKERSKKANWPYLSSILIKNEKVPFFEEYFGQLDYDWLLKATKDRKCVECSPSVIRYVSGKNLSLNSVYRKNDFYMSLLIMDENTTAIKRMFGSRGRYFYVIGEMKLARFYFFRSELNWKIILYILTSYSTWLSKKIVERYTVFG